MNLAIAIVLKNNLWSGALKKLIGIVTTMCPPVCPLRITYSLESAEEFFADCGALESKAMERFPSRIASIESCNVRCDEGSWPQAPWNMPDLSLLKQNLSFSARGDAADVRSTTAAVMLTNKNPIGKDDCSTSAESSCSLSFLDFAEHSSDFSSIRGCLSEYSGSDAHCLSQFRNRSRPLAEDSSRSTLGSPKNKTRCFPKLGARRFATKAR